MEDQNKPKVVIGGVTFQSLEERIEVLEALLKKQGAKSPESVEVKDAVDDGAPVSASSTGAGGSEGVPGIEEVVLEEKVEKEIEEDALLAKETHRPLVLEPCGSVYSEDEIDEMGGSTRPSFTRMSLRYISFDTLDSYMLPFEIDRDDPEYVIISRLLSEREQDNLWDHTRALRRKRHPVSRGARSSSPTRENSTISKLELKITHTPLEEWKKSKNSGNAVLEVATEPVDAVAGHGPTTKPVRLSIRSKYIWKGLKKTTPADVFKYASTMLPPWKLLITYEKEIRGYIDELEKCAEEEKAKKDKESTATKPDGKVDEVQGEGKPTPETSNLQKKKARFANEAVEIRIEPVEGSSSIRKVEIFNFCDICKTEHPEDFDCVAEAISHWRVLIEFMDTDLKPVFDLRKKIAAGTLTEISFPDLWHLFSPGDLLLSQEPRRAYKVFGVSGGRPFLTVCSQHEKKPRVKPLKVECIYMDLEVRGVTTAHETILINEFSGSLPVKSLPTTFLVRLFTMPILSVYPAQFEEKRLEIIASLIQRGKRALELLPFSHKYYRGISAIEGDILDSEIIIDYRNKDFAKPGPRIPMGAFGCMDYDVRELAEGCPHIDPTNSQVKMPIDPQPPLIECGCWNMIDDFVADTARAKAYKGDSGVLKVHTTFQRDLNDDELMLLGPDIRAFLLKQAQWWSIYIDQIQDLDKDVDGNISVLPKFSDLVLPEGHEDLLKAIVKPYISRNPGFLRRAEDESSYLQLKGWKMGKGLAILLHGVPGSGKTAVAEALAAHTGHPLYHLFALDVDSSIGQLNDNLHRALIWNSILLIHDVDILFARRDARHQDMDMNSSISRMAEMLDENQGVIILTSGRLKTFDDVLMSKVNLALHFPQLDKGLAMKVWMKALKRNAMQVENEEEIMAFVDAQWDKGTRWNASQIQNIIDIASALAEGEGNDENRQLELKHVAKILETTSSFADYHKAAIMEQEEEDKAKSGGAGGGKNQGESWEYLSRRGTRLSDD